MLLLFILGISIVIGLIIGVGKTVANGTEANLSKDEPVKAKVIDINRRGSMAATIIFEMENGDRVSLIVPNANSATLLIGDIGMLTYHKTVFKSFLLAASN
jgi:hypothetical protein